MLPVLVSVGLMLVYTTKFQFFLTGTDPVDIQGNILPHGKSIASVIGYYFSPFMSLVILYVFLNLAILWSIRTSVRVPLPIAMVVGIVPILVIAAYLLNSPSLTMRISFYVPVLLSIGASWCIYEIARVEGVRAVPQTVISFMVVGANSIYMTAGWITARVSG
jgi:hypothetical protein